MERYINPHNGRANGKDGGACGNGKTVLIKKKNLAGLVFTWKPLWAFFFTRNWKKKYETFILGFDD